MAPTLEDEGKPGGSSRTTRSRLLLPVIALSVVTLDQLSKLLVVTYMHLGQSIPGEGFIRLSYRTNSGGAFSILANQGLLLTIAAVIGITILVVYLRYLPMESTLLKVGLGLDMGGAVGNLIDRLRMGEVTDFIDVGAWPVFNIADSAITVGSLLIAYYLLLAARNKAT
jgi:signal peptidase II